MDKLQEKIGALFIMLFMCFGGLAVFSVLILLLVGLIKMILYLIGL